MDSFNIDLTEEQRLMKQSCRNFIDRVVAPFLREEWQREWNMEPAERLPDKILKAADDISIIARIIPISLVLLFTNIICIVRMANADEPIPK